MKYPFSGDAGIFQEHQAHSQPVSRLAISQDDQYLFSASEDGSIFIFKVFEKEGRAVKRERETVFADEILVTKSDLEEKNSMMAELKTRVEELKMENEYQLRLKDMNFNEKIKQVTEKFMQEIETLKITSTVLRTDKEKEELRHEEEMQEEKERHSNDIIEMENSQNIKLMAEYEKYQELKAKTADLQEQWEHQMQDMQTQKNQALEELNKHFEERLKEKERELERVIYNLIQLQDEIKQHVLEFEETAKDTERDADAEVMELRHRYEKKLKDEKEIVLKLKGENGIMRKKFNSLQGEIDNHKSEISKMFNEEKKLHSVIKSLEKDIAGLKKEVLIQLI
jgi:DNA repair exonuclease SbcCD ATPase subunit